MSNNAYFLIMGLNSEWLVAYLVAAVGRAIEGGEPKQAAYLSNSIWVPPVGLMVGPYLAGVGK